MPPALILAARIVHIASALYNIAFVYTPLHGWEYGFAVVQYGTLPLLLASGIVLVKYRKKMENTGVPVIT